MQVPASRSFDISFPLDARSEIANKSSSSLWSTLQRILKKVGEKKKEEKIVLWSTWLLSSLSVAPFHQCYDDDNDDNDLTP